MGAVVSSLLYQPPPLSYDLKSKPYFVLRDKNRNEREIAAFFIDNQAPLTILFSHGNAEDIGGGLLAWFQMMSKRWKVNFMAYDYCGYGCSSKVSTTEKDIYADATLAFDFLVTTLKIPPERIILYGRSLGSGPSCYLALNQSKKNQPVRGLILQSALLSVFRVTWNFRWSLPGDLFPNIDRINDIICPITIIHGTQDEIVPFWHGQELYLGTSKEFRRKPLWISGGGHNDLESRTYENQVLQMHIQQFISNDIGRPRVDDLEIANIQSTSTLVTNFLESARETGNGYSNIIPKEVLKASVTSAASRTKIQKSLGSAM